VTALLSPGHAAQLLDRVIAEEVIRCIDTGALDALEERLAIDLGRMQQITDGEMVDLARELITRALHHIADHGWRGGMDEEDLRDRYLNGLSGATP
jgi:hypothetical protein